MLVQVQFVANSAEGEQTVFGRAKMGDWGWIVIVAWEFALENHLNSFQIISVKLEKLGLAQSPSEPSSPPLALSILPHDFTHNPLQIHQPSPNLRPRRLGHRQLLTGRGAQNLPCMVVDDDDRLLEGLGPDRLGGPEAAEEGHWRLEVAAEDGPVGGH